MGCVPFQEGSLYMYNFTLADCHEGFISMAVMGSEVFLVGCLGESWHRQMICGPCPLSVYPGKSFKLNIHIRYYQVNSCHSAFPSAYLLPSSLLTL